jgi:hypothetical protein
VIPGMACGAVGTAAKMLGNLFNRHVLKKSDTTYVEIAAGLFMNKAEREKPVGRIVGFLADYALGAILGVPLVYVLKYTGKDHAFLKGLGYGHFAWVGMYGAVGRALGTSRGVFPLNADTNLSAYFNHSWYGIATALMAKSLADPSFFLDSRSSTEQKPHAQSDSASGPRR